MVFVELPGDDKQQDGGQYGYKEYSLSFLRGHIRAGINIMPVLLCKYRGRLSKIRHNAGMKGLPGRAFRRGLQGWEGQKNLSQKLAEINLIHVLCISKYFYYGSPQSGQ